MRLIIAFYNDMPQINIYDESSIVSTKLFLFIILKPTQRQTHKTIRAEKREKHAQTICEESNMQTNA